MGNLSLAVPGWIEWAGVELPAILRWIGCGAAATGFYVWVQWALTAVRRVGVLGAYLAGRMRKEEAMRPKRFGAEYRAYMGRTGRLTPWV